MVLKFLKYILVGSVGVVCAEEPVRAKGWKQAFKRLLMGGVTHGTPNTQEIAGWARLKKPLLRYQCKVCRVHFWSWKKRQVCHKWQCYKEV